MADVWGPAEVESLGRKKYYLLFQDRHSHEEYIYFMAKKSIIKTFGTDRGGEFNSKDFTDHLERQGTIRHLTRKRTGYADSGKIAKFSMGRGYPTQCMAPKPNSNGVQKFGLKS